MKIEIKRQVIQEIDLSFDEMENITIAHLQLLVGRDNYLRIDKDGKHAVKQDDPNHRHGSISEVYVRDATDLDIAIFKVLNLCR